MRMATCVASGLPRSGNSKILLDICFYRLYIVQVNRLIGLRVACGRAFVSRPHYFLIGGCKMDANRVQDYDLGYNNGYGDGFDEGIEYMFREMLYYINVEPMTKENRRGALALHRWLVSQTCNKKC